MRPQNSFDSTNVLVPERVVRKGRDEGPEEGGRQQWDKPIEFLFSCIAMSVGLGNIWRFPFTAYKNGGGAFLIPYLIVLFLIGKPMYFLELAIGQFSSFGQVKVWKMAPIFKGVGYGSAYGSFCCLSYYCVLMAITAFYFCVSFQTDLPWAQCDPDWENVICVNNTAFVPGPHNMTEESLSKLYYKRNVLHELPDIDNGLGLPEWRLTLCLLVSWILIFSSLVKGVSSVGKVAYFTALFPYVVLIVLLIRGLTLEGAFQGIYYFINPQWEKILQPEVWYAAVGQCFFSLGIGFGPIIMFSSYNPFRHNVYRDAMILSLMDTFTSLLAGFTIFAILGNLSHVLNKPINELADGGASLAFVAYPAAISTFKFVPQLFAVLFFLMLYTLGVGSATPMAAGLITIIHDQFPRINKSWITVFICVVGFASGLIYVTPGGQFMLELVDYFGAGFVIYVMAVLEVIGIAWVYGLSNIVRDIEFMLERKIGLYWKICWGFIIPVGVSAILLYSLATVKPLVHEGNVFPRTAIICGWVLSTIAVLLVPLCALHVISTRKSDTLAEKLTESRQPTTEWGPKSAELNRQWKDLPPVRSYTSQFLDLFSCRDSSKF